MSFLDKLYGKQESDADPAANDTSNDRKPDNVKLIKRLHAYVKNESADNYAKVQDELFNGNAFLLLPSVNGSGPKETWEILEEGADLKLTSVFDVDGLKILGAFTSKEALLKWAKKETEYSAMPSADVIKLCEENSIDRVVIDSNQPTMFVLERQGARVESETLQQDTDVLVGTPSHPIEGALLEKLQNKLAKVSVIQEVYQFMMSRGDEPTLILCFKLDVYNDNAREACMNAVQEAMKGETMEQAVDVFFPKDKSWYDTARGVENSLVYRR